MINRRSIAGLFFLLLIAVGSWLYVDSSILEADRLAFLSVGQGDATFFETAEGIRVMIDGGPDASAEKELSRLLPWWDRRLSAIVITHSHLDHIAGLQNIVGRFRVDDLYMAKTIEVTPELEALVHTARQNGIKVWLLDNDFEIRLGTQRSLELLVEKGQLLSNEQSLVAVLDDGGAKAVFLADIGIEQEQRVMRKLGEIRPELVKIGHHGSDQSTSEELLDRWQPREAIISVGQNNRFGHPSPRVLKKLARNGVQIERTDEQGTLIYKLASRHWQLAP